MRAALVTAIYGGYDTLKTIVPQVGWDVDLVCVTDDLDLTSDEWDVVYRPLATVHPNRAAKEPKMLPWRYTRAPASVWLDASYEVTSPTFVRDVLAAAAPLAQFKHPWRDCVYEEATASLALSKYAGEPLRAQVAVYRAAGHPPHWGLWATGVIARHHTPEVRKLGEDWLVECYRWSFQDQLSEAPILWRMGLRPVELPGTHTDNAWLTYRGSARHDERGGAPRA